MIQFEAAGHTVLLFETGTETGIVYDSSGAHVAIFEWRLEPSDEATVLRLDDFDQLPIDTRRAIANAAVKATGADTRAPLFEGDM